MRAATRRAVAVVVVVVVALSLLPVPPFGIERQTYVTTGTEVELRRLRGLLDDGWTATRADVASSNARMITVERPRIVGLARVAGDVLNNGAGWLAWATGTGVYARKR